MMIQIPDKPTQLTSLLNRMFRGDRNAGNQAMEAMLPALRAVARSKVGGERSGRLVDSTDSLVNEAVVRLFGTGAGRITVNNRKHFFALMCLIMRRVLIDAGRRHDPVLVAIEDSLASLAGADFETMSALDRALSRTRQLLPEGFEVLQLRAIEGLTARETADRLGVSVPTVNRRMGEARAWLYKELRPHLSTEGSTGPAAATARADTPPGP